jgi:hypothetical protein
MWFNELKLWLLLSLAPGLCYLGQAIQNHSETYHDDLVQYVKTDGTPQFMHLTAKRLQDASLAGSQTSTNNLTLYYLFHPGINVPAELGQNN